MIAQASTLTIKNLTIRNRTLQSVKTRARTHTPPAHRRRKEKKKKGQKIKNTHCLTTSSVPLNQKSIGFRQ